MELNELLQNLDQEHRIPIREEKLLKTLKSAKLCWCRREQTGLLTYWEFLWTQLCHTRKRWWALQCGLLLLACQIIPYLEGHFNRVRSMGVIGCLFVVFMIPELWRNRENDSIQVEAASLYSLRQVYAARITLFGIVDIALLTLFCVTLGHMGFSLTEVLSQFLLPVTVTACICFSLLCGKSNFGETMSLAACLIFGGAWWLILLNEEIYNMILPPVWMGLLVAALLLLSLAVRTAVRSTNQYWEAILT